MIGSASRDPLFDLVCVVPCRYPLCCRLTVQIQHVALSSRVSARSSYPIWCSACTRFSPITIPTLRLSCSRHWNSSRSLRMKTITSMPSSSVAGATHIDSPHTWTRCMPRRCWPCRPAGRLSRLQPHDASTSCVRITAKTWSYKQWLVVVNAKKAARLVASSRSPELHFPCTLHTRSILKLRQQVRTKPHSALRALSHRYTRASCTRRIELSSELGIIPLCGSPHPIS